MSAQSQLSSVEHGCLTTGQVARKFKITLQTLHFYDDEGLVTPTRANGRRSYDTSSINRLAFILYQKRLGRTLAQIALLLANADLVLAFTYTTPVLPNLTIGA